MKIDDEVLRILSASTVTREGVTLPRVQLDRKLYERVAKALEAAGAKWNRKAGAHLFAAGTDASDLVERMILTGQISTKREDDFFETPQLVIDGMLSVAQILPTHEVLEPSAGAGAIAAAIQGIGCRRLVCVERNHDRVEMLKKRLGERGVMPAADFMHLHPADVGSFDRIVMNPPFSKLQDIAHIRHAYDFLKPGGRIVAIASLSFRFRQTRAAEDFRQWLDETMHEVEDLPEGSFKSSGTMVNTAMLIIDKGRAS